MGYLDDLRGQVGIAQTGEPGEDAVNVPMIRHWCQAIGDENPVYVDEDAAKNSVHGEIIAPPTMLQAWIMRGFGQHQPGGGGSPMEVVMRGLDAEGFAGIVATNCEQTYVRELHVGDRLTVTSTLTDISDLKQTALGDGHFISSRMDYRDADGEVVAVMDWRVFKFRPRTSA